MNKFVKPLGLFLNYLVGILVFILLVYVLAERSWLYTGIIIGGVFLVAIIVFAWAAVFEHFENL